MKLTKSEYDEIRGFANKEFLDSTTKESSPESFVAMCWTKAFVLFLAKHGYKIVREDENAR